MMVYRAKALYGYSKPGAGPRMDLIYTAVLIPPTWIPWFKAVAKFMKETGRTPKGWTDDMVVEYMMKQQIWHHKNTDISWATAAARAKDAAVKYKATRARGIGGVAVGLLLVALSVVVGLALTSWFDGCYGALSFGPDAFFFKYRERFWFAGLVGHTFEDSFEFCQGREAKGIVVHEYRGDAVTGWPPDNWKFDNTWQVFRDIFVPWHVYTISDLDLHFVGKGENLGFGTYRVREPYDMVDWKEKPVGWGRREFEALEWSDDFLKDFKCR